MSGIADVRLNAQTGARFPTYFDGIDT
jgi:hypothetical protein